MVLADVSDSHATSLPFGRLYYFPELLIRFLLNRYTRIEGFRAGRQR